MQQDQLLALKELYQFWNDRINVISRKDIEQLFERHILHSLSIAKFHQFKSGSIVTDIGTGGGFPGVPLAILFPETSFYLIDSIAKKIKVVSEILHESNITNVTTFQQRAEKLTHQSHFIISRAVAPAKTLIQWTAKSIIRQDKEVLPNGYIFLKGGDLTDELNEIGRNYNVISLSDFFSEAFFETKKIVYIPAIRK